MDDVGDCLGLGEVHLAVEEGALCELTRARDAGSRRTDGGKRLVQHDRAAVQAQLEHLLARVGCRRAEVGHEGLVDRFAGGRGDDMAVRHGVGTRRRIRCVSGRTEDRLDARERVRAADADDAYATYPARRGDGGDRVRVVHEPRHMRVLAGC